MDSAQQPSAPVIDSAGIFLVLITVAVFLLPIFALFPPVAPSPSDAVAQTHAKLGLDRSKSNIKDQSARPSQPTIQSLWIYPVKSCAGIEVTRSKVLPQGLEFDRLFTFAQLKSPFPVSTSDSDGGRSAGGEAHTWHFITQRQFPLLATVSAEVYVPDATVKTPAQVPESFIVLRFPWRERGLPGLWGTLAAKLRGGLRARSEKEVLLPVAFPSREEIAARGYEWEKVTIWKDTVEALNVGVELPDELRLYLGVSNKLGLFRIDPAALREVRRCAPRREEAGYQPVTGFQDAYPLHMVNVSSIKELEGKIARDEDMERLDVRRFRPNIIINGVKAYDEDDWKAVRFRSSGKSGVQASEFHVSCRTVRCKLPNVDQDTGFRHPVEPDKSLRKYREVDEGAPHMGCLGMQLTPLFDRTDDPGAMESWVEVGMAIDVLERGSHRYIKQ